MHMLSYNLKGQIMWCRFGDGDESSLFCQYENDMRVCSDNF